jgi:hypothetical protein
MVATGEAVPAGDGVGEAFGSAAIALAPSKPTIVHKIRVLTIIDHRISRAGRNATPKVH